MGAVSTGSRTVLSLGRSYAPRVDAFAELMREGARAGMVPLRPLAVQETRLGDAALMEVITADGIIMAKVIGAVGPTTLDDILVDVLSGRSRTERNEQDYRTDPPD